MVERVSVDSIADTGGLYSQAIKSTGLLFISGQVGVDKNGKLVGHDIASQTDQVMKNLRATLSAVGCTFNDVIKITIFLVNLDDRPKFHEVRKKYFTEGQPTSTLLVVKSLANKDYLVEVEAVAELPH
jgi:2-iminobutanoate/2-iminopropanoate deaminase